MKHGKGFVVTDNTGDMATDILVAMDETYSSSRRAGLAHKEAWAKVMVRLRAKCAFLAKQHGDSVVDDAMKIVMEHTKKVFEKGEKR